MPSSKPETKHTKYDAFGIWSCIFGMLSLLFIALAIGFITYTKQAGDASSSNAAQLARFVGFLYLEGIVAICGATLGVFGLCRKGRRKRISIIGIALNVPGLAALFWTCLDPTLF